MNADVTDGTTPQPGGKPIPLALSQPAFQRGYTILYVERLLSNPRIERHLDKHHPDILGELRTLIAEVKPQKTKGVGEEAA
jgi:hypothetical protein